MKNEILLRIQKDFPLVQKPFEKIAKELNTTEEIVLNILREEKENNVIRQTSAIFDTKKLGYKSSLVAFNIAPNNINHAVEILNSHPGISHNYERNHSFNIWFTIAIPPTSKYELEDVVATLSKLCNANDYIILPTLKLFKIAVKLDTTQKEKTTEKIIKKEYKKINLTNKHFSLIKEAQNNIDIVSEPFQNIIDKLNINYTDYFETLSELKDAGVMRRFASILNHRKAGFNANAMVVWDIEEKNSEEIGKIAASFSAVSHCYLRPKYENWKYNLFTMIHGKTKEDTQKVINEIAHNIEHKDLMSLYSSREFKKERINYFSDTFDEWENKYLDKRL